MDFVDGKVAPVFLLNEQSLSQCLPSRKKKKSNLLILRGSKESILLKSKNQEDQCKVIKEIYISIVMWGL